MFEVYKLGESKPFLCARSPDAVEALGFRVLSCGWTVGASLPGVLLVTDRSDETPYMVSSRAG